jgi:hypothetical protein
MRQNSRQIDGVGMKTLSASRAAQWSKCLLSTAFRGGDSSSSASEGTAAHWLAEQVFQEDVADDFVGATAPNGFIITREMATHVQEYVDTMMRPERDDIYIESEFTISPHIRGKLDFARVHDKKLCVTDFKYGWRIVDPFYNPQLILATAALLSNHPDIETVELSIFQPRPFHPDGPHRVWKTSRDVISQSAEWLCERAKDAQAPKDALTGAPGSHCRHCAGLSRCLAVAHNIYEMIERTTFGELGDGKIGEELKFLREMAELTILRRDAIEAEMESRISKGRFIPGWGVDHKYGNRCFKSDIDPKAFEFLTGKTLTKQVPRTAADLERDGVPRGVLDQMTYRPKTGYSIVKLQPDSIERIFKK